MDKSTVNIFLTKDEIASILLGKPVTISMERSWKPKDGKVIIALCTCCRCKDITYKISDPWTKIPKKARK